MGKRSVLITLAAAQFLMVLDQSVMNVSISQLVEDFDTTVTTIQAVITLYSLTMAALMVTGGKLGDIWGRRRAFRIGLVIYGAGSALNARSRGASPRWRWAGRSWRGIGAALVLPAHGGAHGRELRGQGASGRLRSPGRGRRRGHRGRPDPRRLGDDQPHMAPRLCRRSVLVIAILLGTRLLKEPPAERETGGLDWVGSVLSASGSPSSSSPCSSRATGDGCSPETRRSRRSGSRSSRS